MLRSVEPRPVASPYADATGELLLTVVPDFRRAPKECAPSSTLRDELTRSIPNLRAFAISLCGNVTRADDLVQETLVKAWDKLATFEEGTNLRGWLFTILRNVFYSELRKRKREVEDVDGIFSEHLTVPPEQLGHMEVSDLLIALQQLSSVQREALILVGAEGFSYEEVAEIAGSAVGTVKSRVSRARRRLSDILGLADISNFGPDRLSQAVVGHNQQASIHFGS